jgi:hypothetical protein
MKPKIYIIFRLHGKLEGHWIEIELASEMRVWFDGEPMEQESKP